MLVNNAVVQVPAVLNKIANRKGIAEPGMQCAGLEVILIGNIVFSGGAVATDVQAELLQDRLFVAMEGAHLDARLVVLVQVARCPTAVNILLGSPARLLTRIHEPYVFIEHCACHYLFYSIVFYIRATDREIVTSVWLGILDHILPEVIALHHSFYT